MKASLYRDYYSYKNQDTISYYKRNNINYEQVKAIDSQINLYECIGRIYKDNISVIVIFPYETTPLTINPSPHFCQNIIKEITNNTAYTVCDASIKNGTMGAYCVIMNKNK